MTVDVPLDGPLDEPLDGALRDAQARDADARPVSAAWAERAAAVLPGGNTRSVLHFDPFPFRVERAEGRHLYDVDRHRYVDLLGNYTAGLLGHSPPAVRAAAHAAIDGGWALGAVHPNEVRLGELIVERFPSIDQVRFTNSGTEANLMALALAVHHTGRRTILAFRDGYHGGVLTFGHGGEAVTVPHDWLLADYNDIDGVDALFAAHGDRFAAVLVEPLQGSGGCIPGDPEFLRVLRDRCDRHRAVLIFDEVMTSRLSLGGSQQVLGITPDLTTLGKYLAGGFTFGAFGGRRHLMAHFDGSTGGALGHAGTFNNNVVSMAAGVATLSEVLTPDVLEAVNARGERLRTRLGEVFAAHGVPMCVTGYGSLMNIHGTPGPVRSGRDLDDADDRWRALLFFAALDAGYYLARRGFIALSIEITDDDIDGFVGVVDEWAGRAQHSRMAEYDLIVRGGSLLDGTGSEARTADVAVRDGLIVEVGRVEGSGAREIDADGALVIPGIVDIHAHYDGQATWDNRLQPSSWHGVTTVVMSNCGVGFAPVHDRDHGRLIELMEGVEDIPGAALHEGLAWNWNSFDEFLDAVDERPHDIDVAAQVPHGALRLHVMGERGANHEDATADDISLMAELARQGIEAGALGFTTSRTRNHRTSTGAYTPTLTAAPDELIGIAEGVGAAGTGVLQVVSDFLDVDDEFSTLRRMVERSGRPLSISVARNPMLPDAFRGILERITTANNDGLAMTGQVAPRAVGLILGLECTLNPFLTVPAYREIADRPLVERVALLRDPEVRARVLQSADERSRDKLGGSLIGRFDLMFEMLDEPDYEPKLGDSIGARAARDGVTPEELALDVMLAGDGKGFLYLPFLNYVDGNLDGCHEMLVHPHTVPGLGDGGAHVGTICDGSFPTTLLQYWGRDRDHDRIPLPFLVQRHCRDTARTVGLSDRGVLAPGYRADLNVVDFDRLRLHKPVIVHDLPAGGRRLLQRADGWRHTIVAGQETYHDGEATEALPGRLVRGAKPAPTGSAR